MASSTTSFVSATKTIHARAETCTTAAPGKYGHVPFDACNSYYPYDPNIVTAIAFTVLFGMSAIGHTVQAIIYKKRFCWVIIVACLWETTSFILKSLGAHNQQNVGYATSAQLLFLTAPLWINAFAYMVVGRMIYFFLPEKKVYGIKATWLAKFFIWLDIFSFIVQATGGSMLDQQDSPSTMKLGMTIYRVGIAVQELFIILFLILTQRFHARMSELDRSRQLPRTYKWRLLTWTIYVVLALITMRIIYRFIEFSQGLSSNNPILTTEAYSYGLDAFPMWFAALLLNIVHPALVLRGPESEFPRLTRKEKKALKKEKKDAKKARKQEKKDTKNARRQGRKDGADVSEYQMVREEVRMEESNEIQPGQQRYASIREV